MGISNATLAEVDIGKIVDYLLSPVHPVGRFKCVFFERLGFSREHPTELAAALKSHAAQSETVTKIMSPYGEKQIAAGIVVGPNGQSSALVTVWLTPSGESIPRLITAYPARGTT